MRRLSLKQLFYGVTLIFMFITFFSCEPAVRLVEKVYEVRLVVDEKQNLDTVKDVRSLSSFSKSVDYLTVKAVGEGRVVEERFNDINSIVIRLPRGNYRITVNGYTEANVLYFEGSVDITVPNAGVITVPVKLTNGVLKIKVELEDSNFSVKEATLTLVNDVTEEMKTLSISANNSDEFLNVETSVEPGLWRVWAEVIVRNKSNANDLRYAKSSLKVFYVEPSKTTIGLLRVRVPSVEEIGTLVQVAFVYDGDTFKDTSNINYRVIGIDAPEISSTGTKPKGEFGEEAKTFFQNFVESSNGFLRVLTKGTDVYGRTLAYVFDRYGRRFYEEEVTKVGLARVLFYDDTEVPILSARIKEGYYAAFVAKSGIFSKWENAPEIGKDTADKEGLVGKIVWMKGTVSTVVNDSDKYTLVLDDGWAIVEIRREEYIRMFGSSLGLLQGKEAKFYGELWKEGGTYKILLRAEFEYLVLE